MKKMRFLSLILALVLAFSLIVSGCASNNKANNETSKATEETAKETTEATEAAFDPSQYPLGFVTVLKGHPVVQTFMAGFTTKAEELGYPAEIFAGDGADAQEMIKFGEQAIAKGMKGMIIYLLDPSVYPLIKKAADAGIPVVEGHTMVANEADVPGLKAWVSCDPFQYGKDSAKAIAEKIGKKGKVAITQGSFNTTENNAAKAFMDEMKNYPDITVLQPIEEGFDPAQATAKAAAIIQANKDLAGAFSTTGGGPATWSGAADQTSKKDLVIIGMDYVRQNLDLVRDGKVYAVVAQPLFEEHEKCAELLDKLLRGETVPFANPIEAPLVTKENVQKYYDLIAKVDKAFGR